MKVLSSSLILCVVFMCCDFVCSKSSKAKAGHGKHGKKASLLDQDLADKLGGLLQDWTDNILANAPNSILETLYDPIDVNIMLDSVPTLTDTTAILSTARFFFASFPLLTEIELVKIEAYSYRFGGFKMANSIFNNVGRDADGNIIFIYRGTQIWRRFGKTWKLHRENINFVCSEDCQK